MANNTSNVNGGSGLLIHGSNAHVINVHDNTTTGNGFAPPEPLTDDLGPAVTDDGITVNVTPGPATLRGNHADQNADHGIDATGGTTDGGGNTATGNHGSPQCVGVSC